MSGHGGKRPNAGRKPGGTVKHRKVEMDTISKEVLRSVDSVAIWKKLLKSNSPKTIATSMMYLMDRVFGRPVQTLQGGSTPVKIEFSLGMPATPAWLSPNFVPPAVESRVVIPELEQSLERVISEVIDDKPEE